MRGRQRRRRYVSPRLIAVARCVGFRYDYYRDAYILAVVGDRFGPVLKSRRPRDSGPDANCPDDDQGT